MKNTKIAIGIVVAIFIVFGGILIIFVNAGQSSTYTEQSVTGGTPANTVIVATTTPAKATSTKTTTKATTTKTTTTTTTTTGPKTYTMADVAAHNSRQSCWTTINAKVYDVTTWISQHPGGQEAILSLCGTDGSSAFNDQHGGQRRPEQELASFFIGNLK